MIPNTIFSGSSAPLFLLFKFASGSALSGLTAVSGGVWSPTSAELEPRADRCVCNQTGVEGGQHADVPVVHVRPPPLTSPVEDLTDKYLFNTTLEAFVTLRDRHDPSYFWWASDGCTESPDAPFGFPFVPACYRHDFGYEQYRRQGRFTRKAKARIDNNFRKDIYHQCSAPGLQADICRLCAADPRRKDIDCKHRADMCKFPAAHVCKCLADIYYQAVKAFGGTSYLVPGRKDKRFDIGAILHPKIPGFDIAKLGICLSKNMDSAVPPA